MKTQIPKAPLQVALVQMCSGDNLNENIGAIDAVLTALKGQKVDLIILPENALYLRLDKTKPMEVQLNLREGFWLRWQKYCNETGTQILVGSAPYKGTRSKKLSNAMVYLAPKKKPKVVYEKIHLFDVDVQGAPPSRESDYFNHGKKPAVLNVHGWRLGLSICYDVRFSELYRAYARQGVHALLVPAAFLVPTGRAHWHVLLRARAIESQAYVLAPAQSGGHRNAQGLTRETFGHSLAVDPWGEVLCDLGAEGAKAEIVQLMPEKLMQVYKQIPQARHRRL